MNSKVKVTADAVGNVVIPSKNNAAWGHIRVEQERIVIDERGFARKKRVSALIPGLINDLKSFDWKVGQELKGNIIFKEQCTPFNPRDPERDYKIAGRTGIVCCIFGEPIYRKTFYNTNPEAQDVQILDENKNPISHTNGEEIRIAYKQITEQDVTLENETLGSM
tara:strand:+ start:632 stop:1126 length:495 start_codon:yes stop_codon:yes gene_type:complete